MRTSKVGMSLQRDDGDVPVRVSKTMRRLVPIGVLASLIVALTASQAFAASNPCTGFVKVTLTLLKFPIGPPLAGTVIVAERPAFRDNPPIEVVLGKTDISGSGQFLVPVEKFCWAQPSGSGIAIFYVLWVEKHEFYQRLYVLTTLTVSGPFQSPYPTINLGTLYVSGS